MSLHVRFNSSAIPLRAAPLVALFCAAVWTPASAQDDSTGVTLGQEVLERAWDHLEQMQDPEFDRANFQLVGLQHQYLLSPATWRVTFKQSGLIPEDPATEMVGAGGEIFVDVDPATWTIEVRFGE